MNDRNTPMSEPEIDELEKRVEQLEEKTTELEEGAIDAQGRKWTKSDLLNMGLTRRQAMAALGAIAGGTSIGAAIYQAIEPAAAQASTSDGDDDVGTPDNRVDVFADGVDANTLSTDELNNTFAETRSWGTGSASSSPDTDLFEVPNGCSGVAHISTAQNSGRQCLFKVWFNAADGVLELQTDKIFNEASTLTIGQSGQTVRGGTRFSDLSHVTVIAHNKDVNWFI